MKVKVSIDHRELQIIDATTEELQQARIFFKRRINNWRFDPRVKRKVWDGCFQFLNKNMRISTGLIGKLKEMCKEYDFPLEIENEEKLYIDINETDFRSWVDNIFKDSPIKPRDYQVHAAFNIIKNKRSISEIATSAGKTLIIYLVFLWLKTHNQLDDGKQFLIIVPNIMLVEQTYEKFIQYSERKDILDFKVQLLYGTMKKDNLKADVLIGTFQTLAKLDIKFFNRVKAVCIDECHYAHSVSLQKIVSKCIYSDFRFGLSGTTKSTDESANSFTVISLLGPMVQKLTADFLFGNNEEGKVYATPVDVTMVYLDYLPHDMREQLFKLYKRRKDLGGSKLLTLEKRVMLENTPRFNKIVEIISKANKNTLVLFQNVQQGHGKRISDELKNILDSKYKIHYIDGSVDSELRDIMKKDMEEDTDSIHIMVASFGTFSTGIDVSNIHYIFLTESYKSEVIIKQSVGRGMRLSEGKDKVKIIDFIDDYSLPGYKNYFLQHSEAREQIYKDEKYSYRKKTVKF